MGLFSWKLIGWRITCSSVFRNRNYQHLAVDVDQHVRHFDETADLWISKLIASCRRGDKNELVNLKLKIRIHLLIEYDLNVLLFWVFDEKHSINWDARSVSYFWQQVRVIGRCLFPTENYPDHLVFSFFRAGKYKQNIWHTLSQRSMENGDYKVTTENVTSDP